MKAVFGKFLYEDLAFCLEAFNLKESEKLFEKIEQLRGEFYFLGYVKYEFYRYLVDKDYQSYEPFAFFYAFKKRAPFTPQKTDDDAFLPRICKKLDKAAYKRGFDAVKEALKRGQSYQVNLTSAFSFETSLDEWQLFCTLANRQNTPFKAFLQNKYLSLLSFSPELFFKTNRRKITTKPMKGTICRGKTKKDDERLKKFLQNDAKNRSENLMIVDLLRNDLAKICEPHTQKTRLFEISSYKTLHQMTSTVKAKLRPNTTLFEIFSALFPCGSITGAPKIETMKIINSLEEGERGVYCGAIGVIHGERSKFSVAIRTLQRRAGESEFSCQVGSGLVYESDFEGEFEELGLKAKFVTGGEFEIFETMRCENGAILFFKEHLLRLLKSGEHFGFDTTQIRQKFSDILAINAVYSGFEGLDLKQVNDEIFKNFNQSVWQKHNLKTPLSRCVVKLSLAKTGGFRLDFFSLNDAASDYLILAKSSLNSHSDNLFHKTTRRSFYEKHSLWRSGACFDVAFFNEKNELCEGSRSNLILKKGENFYTPPLASGLLAGVFRQFLLTLGVVSEAVLTKNDLFCNEIYAINSVRGVQKLRLKNE